MNIMLIFEMIGTVAFAVSGALLAIRKGLDLFGIIILAITTALGGGIMRDVLMGNVPPLAFIKPIYFIVSICSAIFAILFYTQLNGLRNILQLFDAIGLSAFTAIGTDMAIQYQFQTPFLVISLGLLTGVGGGVLRDVFADDVPLIFRKEVYAVASIAGSIAMFYLRFIIGYTSATYVCFVLIFVIRILAIYYNINLPIIIKTNTDSEERRF